MNVKTEFCWSGHDKFTIRLTVCKGTHGYTGARFVMATEEDWTRKIAKEARDLLVAETGVNRNSIKFI